MKSIMLVISCIAFMLLLGCQNTENASNSNTVSSSASSMSHTAGGKLMNDVLTGNLTIKDIPQNKWDNLAKKKIFFGHQSVGYNIVDGIKTVLTENPQIRLNIVETQNPSDFDEGVFAHSRIGTNEDPQSKTEDFSRIINSGVGNKVDIAFHKYCFIDVNGNSDVKQIFNNYALQMKKMTGEYPDVRFIHVTIPLTVIQTGPKAWIKKILGKPIGGVEANIKRNEYNQLLKDTYRGGDLIFDLAAVESGQSNGDFTTFQNNGQTYLSIFKGYSSDGGHLNHLGQKVVAEKLLIFLATIQK